MAKRRRLKTIVERTVTITCSYDPETEGVPSEADLVEAITDALGSYEPPEPNGYVGLPSAKVGQARTSTRRVPAEA